MKTTHVLFSVAGVTIVSSSLFSCQQKQEQKYKPYNIVYIMTDDHTAQMMSCYDRRYVHTPNLDRIASDGVRFANSFVANSLSGPSRACMLTGKHSCGNKFYDNSTCVFDGTQQTFPKILRENGYQSSSRRFAASSNYREVALGKSSYWIRLLGNCSRSG